MLLKNCFALFLGGFLLFSCNNDPVQSSTAIDTSHLIGRWEITKAVRNGKEIETLIGAYYEFLSESQMKTNLTSGMDATYEIKVSDNQIKQSGEPSMVYLIDSLTPDFLAMSMSINNFPFKVELKKVPANPNMEASDSTGTDTLKQL
jgi:hypothetical protein